ncbi:hypothetical protein [Paenibacillus sp. UNCCL117]|uniref:hypothetical protein n=2 Tax=unclassified Paenibacillus TaxID=185978 RepID=UPI00092FFE95|nr:hypothetical protein [Paenibacillus sp. UNCCL117]
MSNVLVTLMIMPVLLFLAFAIVPFFVYAMKANHLNTIANHALKEAEAVGYVSTEVRGRLGGRLAALGMGPVAAGGVTYPSFTGSTEALVLRDAPDPTVKLELIYPAPNLTRIVRAIRGGGGGSEHEGFYHIVLYGRSEAYE